MGLGDLREAMQEGNTEALRERLEKLKSEHRNLDETIRQLTSQGSFDQLQIQRLKKKKLALKDEIQRLEDRIFPDIIA